MNVITRAFRVNPGLLNLVSGIGIGVSVNLYTGLLGGDALPSRWTIVLAASIFALLSAIFWAALAWNLEGLQRLAYTEAPAWVNSDAVWSALLRPRRARLLWLAALAVLFGAAGLSVLLVDVEIARSGQISATSEASDPPVVPKGVRQDPVQTIDGGTAAGQRIEPGS